jgi:hypothetical protein
MVAGGSNMDTDVKNWCKLVNKMDTANKNLRLQLDKLMTRLEKLEKVEVNGARLGGRPRLSLGCQWQIGGEIL